MKKIQAYKLHMELHQMVYGKTCHLPAELEHKAYWALRLLNFNESLTKEKRRFQLLELEEMRHNAYESTRIYKQKIKAYHDRKKNFQPSQQVLLFNSRLKLFPGKLKSKWPIVIKDIKTHGVVEIMDQPTDEPKRSWIVNGQRLKIYNGGVIEKLTTSICLIDPWRRSNVKLVTLKKRSLGGNPTFFAFSRLSSCHICFTIDK